MDASEVRSRWANRTGEFSPRYYAYYGPDEASERLEAVLATRVPTDASILELGCSSGRHLSYLHGRGYENLAGIEINEDALDVMETEYPTLASRGTFFADSIESVVESLPSDRYDVVFSVQTLQHVHPDAEWVFDAIQRIADRLVVTVEIEGIEGDEPVVERVDGLPLTRRNWRSIFDDDGFAQVEREGVGANTLRVFENVDRRETGPEPIEES
ncbi:MAG: class I SAM-dependent methyltransferase [Halanaeroarchaeum sp.]